MKDIVSIILMTVVMACAHWAKSGPEIMMMTMPHIVHTFKPRKEESHKSASFNCLFYFIYLCGRFCVRLDILFYCLVMMPPAGQLMTVFSGDYVEILFAAGGQQLHACWDG